MVDAISMLAQTDAIVSDGISGILTALNLGLAGIGLLAFVKGWIVPGKTYQDALEREKRKDEELESLRNAMTDKVMPELERSRTILQTMGRLVERVMAYVEREEYRQGK